MKNGVIEELKPNSRFKLLFDRNEVPMTLPDDELTINRLPWLLKFRLFKIVYIIESII